MKKTELTFNRESLSPALKSVVVGNVRWLASIKEAYPELTGYTLYNIPNNESWKQLIFDRGYNLIWPKPCYETESNENLRRRLESAVARYLDQISIIEDSKGLRYAIMGTPMDAIVICRIVDGVIKASSGIHICINSGM